jgi:hypothetical protein
MPFSMAIPISLNLLSALKRPNKIVNTESAQFANHPF